jgi:hypothetical protein
MMMFEEQNQNVALNEEKQHFLRYTHPKNQTDQFKYI